MKKYLVITTLVLFVASFTGCAMGAAPVTGFWYTDVSGGLAATDSDQKPTKSGSATANSILGLVATGDASIETAAKNGGITQIHHVDYSSKSILGIIASYTITVYGN